MENYKFSEQERMGSTATHNPEVPRNREQEAAENISKFILGAAAVGAACYAGKEFWKWKGDSVKEKAGGVVDELVDGCMAKAKGKLEEVMGLNQRMPSVAGFRETLRIIVEDEKRREENIRAESPKPTEKTPDQDVEDGEIIDTQPVENESGETIFEAVGEKEEPEESSEDTSFKDLMEKDHDFAEKFEKISGKTREEMEGFMETLPKEKRMQLIFCIIGLSEVVEKQGLGQKARENIKVEKKEEKTVSESEHQALKEAYLKMKEERDFVQNYLLKIMAQAS